MKRLIVLVLGMVLLGACSSSTDDGDDAAESTTTTVTAATTNTQDGSVDLTVVDDEGNETQVEIGGGGDVPEGFPAPVPAGGEVQQSIVTSDSTGAWTLIVLYPVNRFDELVDTYESWVTSEGYTLQKVENAGEIHSTTLVGTDDARPGGVSIVVIEQDGNAILNLTVPNG